MSLIPFVDTTVAERSMKCSRPGCRWMLLSLMIGNWAGSDEHLEATVLLVKAAKGHRVGVEVQDEPQSVSFSLPRLHYLCLFVPLHLFHQALVV